jgi:L,D-transpeptidase ErfK/SrfK
MGHIRKTIGQVSRLTVIAGLLASLPVAAATTHTLYNDRDTVVGWLSTARAESSDTLLDIGRAHGFGYHDLKLLNPDVDTWLPGEGQKILLPAQFILPNVPRQGIVLNIPEMRLYFFPERKRGEPVEVITYPLGVGREGWSTPYVKTRVTEKKVRPAWHPPESIREEHAAMGKPLPKRVEPGPENPLGEYALKLGLPAYLIHGTNKPYGVGMRVSHGCIRLYPEDIEDLFQRVKVGTPVNIINQPYKIGELDGVIYLEVHPHLVEDTEYFEQNSLTEVVKYVVAVTEEQQYEIDWSLVKQVVEESRGIPVAIGMHTPVMQVSAGQDILPEMVKPLDMRGMDLRLESQVGEPAE